MPYPKHRLHMLVMIGRFHVFELLSLGRLLCIVLHTLVFICGRCSSASTAFCVFDATNASNDTTEDFAQAKTMCSRHREGGGSESPCAALFCAVPCRLWGGGGAKRPCAVLCQVFLPNKILCRGTHVSVVQIWTACCSFS